MRIVSEQEFSEKLMRVAPAYLKGLPWPMKYVTGPGRSGAIMSVYMSHYFSLSFVPYGQMVPELEKVLVVDTAILSGRTLRKAARKYGDGYRFFLYNQDLTGRVKFWYEGYKMNEPLRND